MSDRKLASVRTVSALEPIEGADRIVLASIDGWKLITQKDNFKVGDLCVFFEIDSFLPVKPVFEFLRKGCFKSTKNLGDGFRIKTMKMKGQISQGLILPLSEILLSYDWRIVHYDGRQERLAVPEIMDSDENFIASYTDGEDLTEALGVQKYEKPIPSNLVGKVRSTFPHFIRKTDEERIQNLKKTILNKYYHADFEVTEKFDGSSMTIYVKDEIDGVCSRNMDLLPTDDNTYWQVANRVQIHNALRASGLAHLAPQGELVGPGIQGNRLGLSRHEFYVFKIWHIEEQRYLNPDERMVAYDRLNEFTVERLKHVTIVDHVKISSVARPDTLVEDLLELAKGCYPLTNNPREGIVFKHVASDFSFKAINNEFLLAGGD